ncbi:MAG TPA: nucleotide pyrophosphohydrolase [Planctomycetes bacterium]|nr:nucleotide pyrophosphohydrolase [Planctomycetota bacterium]
MKINDFQQAINKTFGARDRARGLERSFLWLVEEVGELAEAIRHGEKSAVEHEVGDVLAWLVSVANIAEIDVNSAAKRFYDGCPYCHNAPCRCDEDGRPS